MLNESVKEKIEEAAHNYLHEIRGDDKPTWQSEVMFDSGILKTFKSGSKFGYQLASDSIQGEKLFELSQANYKLLMDNARLKEKLEVAVKALEYFVGEKKITYCQTATGVHQIETYPANDFLKQIRDDKEMG